MLAVSGLPFSHGDRYTMRSAAAQRMFSLQLCWFDISAMTRFCTRSGAVGCQTAHRMAVYWPRNSTRHVGRGRCGQSLKIE
eukprot:s2423_g13.t1